MKNYFKRSSSNDFLKVSPQESIKNAVKFSNWQVTYGVVDLLIEFFDVKTFLEIGVAYGGHATHILKKYKNLQYWGVDPYIANYDQKDGFSNDVNKLFKNKKNQEAFDLLHYSVKVNLSTFGKRCNLHRTKSETFFKKNKKKFDLIYIDGDHRFPQVYSDLSNSWKFVKTGGVLCGDDYSWEGVKRAVVKFSEKNMVDYYLIERGDGGGQTFFFLR